MTEFFVCGKGSLRRIPQKSLRDKSIVYENYNAAIISDLSLLNFKDESFISDVKSDNVEERYSYFVMILGFKQTGIYVAGTFNPLTEEVRKVEHRIYNFLNARPNIQGDIVFTDVDETVCIIKTNRVLI